MDGVTVCSDFGAQENKVSCCFHFSSSLCHEVMGLDAMILVFWMRSFKPAFSLFSSTFIKRLSSACLYFLPLGWCHLHIWGYWYCYINSMRLKIYKEQEKGISCILFYIPWYMWNIQIYAEYSIKSYTYQDRDFWDIVYLFYFLLDFKIYMEESVCDNSKKIIN